jgi:hypothetical protein
LITEAAVRRVIVGLVALAAACVASPFVNDRITVSSNGRQGTSKTFGVMP